MKTKFNKNKLAPCIVILTCLLFVAPAFSGDTKKESYFSSSEPDLKDQAQQWLQNRPVEFLENKGQMTDMSGNPVPFVLFKAEVPGMDMYITEK